MGCPVEPARLGWERFPSGVACPLSARMRVPSARMVWLA